jgi:hypothetical protein
MGLPISNFCCFAACCAVTATASFSLVPLVAAQSPQASSTAETSDWVGRLTWKHRVERPEAWAETEGKADIKINGTDGNLMGTIKGSHSATSVGACAGSTVAPGEFRAKLRGSHTPAAPGDGSPDAGEQAAMAIQASEKQTTPMRMQISCPGAPPVVSHHAAFYENYEKPLSGLRATSDGGFVSHDMRTAAGEAGSTMTTTYTMTIKESCKDENAPARGFVFYRGGGGIHSEPSRSTPVIERPLVGIRMVYEERVTMVGGDVWYRVQVPGMPSWPQVEITPTGWVPASEVGCTRPTRPLPAPPKRVAPSGVPLAPSISPGSGTGGRT